MLLEAIKHCQVEIPVGFRNEYEDSFSADMACTFEKNFFYKYNQN